MYQSQSLVGQDLSINGLLMQAFKCVIRIWVKVHLIAYLLALNGSVTIPYVGQYGSYCSDLQKEMPNICSLDR